MDWQNWEEARKINFTVSKQDLASSCKECGAAFKASNEKLRKKKQMKHVKMHFNDGLYVRRLLERIGLQSPQYEGTERERIERFLKGLEGHYARAIWEFTTRWARENCPEPKSLPRKRDFEYRLSKRFESLWDSEKEELNKIAAELVSLAFPELRADPESKQLEEAPQA